MALLVITEKTVKLLNPLQLINNKSHSTRSINCIKHNCKSPTSILGGTNTMQSLVKIHHVAKSKTSAEVLRASVPTWPFQF